MAPQRIPQQLRPIHAQSLHPMVGRGRIGIVRPDVHDAVGSRVV